MQSPILIALVLLAGHPLADLSAAPALADRIEEVLVRMGDKDADFRVEELQALSPEELALLCDRLLPETMHVEPALSKSLTRQLVAELGVQSFERRRAAERQLTLAGPNIERWLGNSDDAEVQARLAAIRLHWLPRDDLGPYAAAWERFAHDANSRHVPLFADRAARAIERSPPRGARREVIAAMIARLVRSSESADAGPFVQMLPRLPAEAAADMVKMFGQGRPRNVYPRLLLQALDDPRPAVVTAAIAGSYRSGGTAQSPEVQRRLERILTGTDADLRFAAAGPLFVDFGDAHAFRLLLEAAHSDDKARWRQALDAIGNQANFGKRAPADLATALEPVLQSKDADRRYAAVNALGVFADESVWPALVSALGDDDAQVAAAARRHLQSQPDREGIMRRLADAARTFPSPSVRDAAQALLQDLARDQ